MSKQITLTLPDEVYEQIQRTAAADQRPIAEVLTDTIVQATPIFSVDARRPAMLREKAAFLEMHSQLLGQYEGQYVAIYQGQVIDHDHDVEALVRRVEDNLHDEVVLIKQVTEEPDRVLHLRSPRFVRNP